MTQITLTEPPARELDARTNDGITTRLLWHPTDDSLAIEVVGPDSAFELSVAAHEALDAFHHPFAYAAYHGVAYSNRREPVASGSRAGDLL